MNKTILFSVVLAVATSGSFALAADYRAPSGTLVAQNTNQNATVSESAKKAKKKIVKNKNIQKTKAIPARAQNLRKQPVVKKTAIVRTSPVKRQVQQPPTTQRPSTVTNFPVTAPAMSATPTTVTTTVPNDEDSSQKGKFGFKYRSNNAIMLNALESPSAPQNNLSMDHEVQAWDRVDVSYHISDNVSVDLMPQFYHTWFGDQSRPQNPNVPSLQQPYAAYMGETGLGVIDSKLAQLGNGWVLDGYAGYFFPTAEWEQDAGTLGATRTNLGLGRSFGKLDVKWVESFWWYFERYSTSSIVDNTGAPVQNIEYNLWSLLDFTYNFTKKFYVDLTGGFMNAASYADTSPTTWRPAVLNDYLIIDPEIGYSFTKNFTLSVGLWEEADMRAQTVAYMPFNGSQTNTQAYFMTTIAF